MSYSLPLTQQSLGYDGELRRMEVVLFTKDIHDKPGIYLQEVEGCGYTVYQMTPIEALALAAHLTQAANETIAEFKE